MVSLSGGQMQRVALARSLVYQPQLLLLDEPLSNLDAKLRMRLRDDLRRIIKQTGVTALYVTHDQAEAVVLGDRIGVMRDGKLLQMAPPGRDLQSSGRSVRRQFHRRLEPAARAGSWRATASSRTVDLGGAGRIDAWTPQPLAHRRQARVALRPENVRLGERGADQRLHAAACVERRYQGMQTVYDVDLGGQRLEALEFGTARAMPSTAPSTSPCRPRRCWAYRDDGAGIAE